MTSEQFEQALNDLGIETTVDSDGVVVMLLDEKEYGKTKKYDRIVKEIGWKRSWGRRLKTEICKNS